MSLKLGSMRSAQTEILSSTPTGASTIFRVTGLVKVHQIVGVVEGTFGAAACGVHLTATVGALTAVKLCESTGALDLNAAAIGSLVTLTGVITAVAVKTVNAALGSVGEQLHPFVLGTNTQGLTTLIKMSNAGAANAGKLRWFMLYEPLSRGAKVEPVNF